jgi:tRNA wybutosine-synthesizing protein 2
MTGNPLQKALRSSLKALPTDFLASINITIDALLSATPKTYSIYEPLLLLPPHTFTSQEWKSVLSQLGREGKYAFFSHFAANMNVTHIALNAPISPTVSGNGEQEENIQRRPNITPLHGDFRPFATTTPTTQDFDSAFWVSTRQNGITQSWAPLYTMFSRGNINEKARLLTLAPVKSAVSDPKGCTAVDLYAGIGYFAFSNAKAGCAKVLGFELNPWSVEGLRRGARANKWSCSVIKTEQLPGDFDVHFGDRLTVFEMGNEVAADVVEKGRDKLPPVRHVNLGLLPTSSGAYDVAVRCLDPERGGWLHVHENFAMKEIVGRAEEVRKKVHDLVMDIRGDTWHVDLEHVEKVKTYAPGVMHCVLDVCLRSKDS